MAPWLSVVEAYMVQMLLRSPTFHAGVRQVARKVHQIRHGVHPEDMGGTKLDRPEMNGYLQHFWDEVRQQAGHKPSTSTSNRLSQATKQPPTDSKQSRNVPEQEHNRPPLITNFLDELRSQFRGGSRK